MLQMPAGVEPVRPALTPMPTLLTPVVLLKRALRPEAVLLEPVVLLQRA